MPKSLMGQKKTYVSGRVGERVFKLTHLPWLTINDHARANDCAFDTVVVQLTASFNNETPLMTTQKFDSGEYGMAEIYGVVALLKAFGKNTEN